MIQPRPPFAGLLPLQRTFLATALLLAASLAVARAVEITPAQREFFEAKVRPILAEHCYSCHNSVDKMKGDLALDYRGAVLAGKVVVPRARLIVTLPSSSGCRNTSSVRRLNSGSSSRNNTPLWANEISPGIGMERPPSRPASEIVW